MLLSVISLNMTVINFINVMWSISYSPSAAHDCFVESEPTRLDWNQDLVNDYWELGLGTERIKIFRNAFAIKFMSSDGHGCKLGC
jgi:hypothetical protein